MPLLLMRPGSPAVYACKRSGDRGMHKWQRTSEGARCMFCKLVLTGDDADDVFRGPATPIGQIPRVG